MILENQLAFREIRESKGLKIREVAKLSGVGEVTISRMELYGDLPKQPKISRICGVLGLDAYEVRTYDVFWRR